MMHWASILTVLILTAASAWLVIVGKWDVLETFGTMGAAAVLLVAGLIVMLLAISTRDDRRLLIEEIWRTTRNDLRELLELLRLSGKPLHKAPDIGAIRRIYR